MSICNSVDCKIFQKFCTPDTNHNYSHYTLLCQMDRPVNDLMNPDHYISHGITTVFIAEKLLYFDQLMNELPPLDKDPF